MPGQLFTSYFLEEGILHTHAWQESLSLHVRTSTPSAPRPSPFIEKAANFHIPSTKPPLSRSSSAPSSNCSAGPTTSPSKAATTTKTSPTTSSSATPNPKTAPPPNPPRKRYPDALAVAESKRLNRPLDARGKTGSPHGQILRYLATADIASDGRIRWGMLTNGRIWRLYDRRALPRASGYYEVDLQRRCSRPATTTIAIRAFRLLFGRPAFSPQHGAQTSFLEDAIAEGRRYEEQVATDLSGTVFDKVYPALISALADKSGAELDDVRQAALIFLYRLLFLLYAEDRDLLPVNDSRYDDYGLRKSVRDDIDKRIARRRRLFQLWLPISTTTISTLCRQVDEGDPSIGLPPYNGGLFRPASRSPATNRCSLSDARALPHYPQPQPHQVANPAAALSTTATCLCSSLAPSTSACSSANPPAPPKARSSSAPTATPARTAAASTRPNRSSISSSNARSHPCWKNAKPPSRPKPLPCRATPAPKPTASPSSAALDPAAAALNLKVLDPAMGSGHFLVTAVDYLSDAIADLVEYAPTAAPWLEHTYTSPLLERIAAIRADILGRAHAAKNWVINEPELTDQAIIRRMVLKRCIYGVDKNPLTVELAKVSLWLHSFTVGAPLSFLDHHLRCGDSLIGLRVHDAVQELSRLGGFTSASAIQAAENATGGMQQIEEMSDADIAQVEESATLFREVEKTTSALRGLLNTLCGVNWHAAGMKKRQRAEYEAPLQGVIVSQEEKAFSLLSHGTDSVDPADPVRQLTTWPDFTQIWRAAKEIADRENFLHWEVAFPGVWHRWQDDRASRRL